ncbi:Glycosyl hydrolases family 31 protein [Trichomonas vaginalis G3]|uniref:Glucosidase II subunit alpha n=1 Tax=Trichomonas vaginalis (strain ATCC PRA-98 / G3) TaxID=412133 RepID=A2FHI6_TRIV3|nr:glycosyl hydrolase [Trichomonas vaginalis G3]EAX95621.1 Glycosyl hydrolases family 31 protein [Trichomonas vaginalis G3]KAI5487447.1 alpha-glucosidase family [Trichomonas vaginalis G3]|eukprot:XP_001308551.1 glycosyl hydrolase [Trichomonas vaginalis G3]
MFGILLRISYSAIRTCEDLDFCAENIGKSQTWAIDKSTIIANDSVYFTMQNEEKKSKISFQISYIANVGFRFRANPIPADNFFRYDLSNESLVIDQDTIKNLEVLKSEIGDKIILKRDSMALTVEFEPFNIYIENNGERIITINGEQSLLFQHHMEVEEPDKWESFTDLIPNGPTAVACDFKFEKEGVHFSGLGERSAPLNIENQQEPIRLYNTDGYEYDKDSYTNLYGSVPFLLAHASGYNVGVFWMNPSDTFVKFDENKAFFISEGGFLDFVIIQGSFYEILNSYTLLTGRPQHPPLFSLGYHQSRWDYKNLVTVKQVIKELDDANIPFDVFWLDIDHLEGKTPFTVSESFQPLEDLIELLDKQHRNLVRVCDPHFPTSVDNRQYKETRSRKLLVQTSKGMTFIGDSWPGQCSFPDFLNTAVRDYWAKQFNYGMDVTGQNVFYWNDMNEPSIFKNYESTFPKDNIHFGGVENREVHNIYGHLNSFSTFDGLLHRNNDQNIRPFVLSRSFFSGSQRYAFTWSGDNTATWDHLHTSVHMAITSGICGIPLTGSDVGGFLRSPDELLLTRWMQLGSLCYPFFREHCHHKSQRREPSNYEGETLNALRNAIINRYKLLPTIYTFAYESSQTGSPITRPLFAEFPDNDDSHENGEDFMIGDLVLVKPIVDEDDEEKETEKLNYIEMYNTKFFPLPMYGIKGNEKVKSDEISKYPVYLREGKILPLFSTVTKNTHETLRSSDIDLVIALNEEGTAKGRLYLDDGISYNYKNGEYLYVELSYKDGKVSYQRIGDKEQTIPDFLATKKISNVIILEAGKEPNTIKLDISF